MSQEEEVQALREENAVLKAQVAELLPLKEQVEQLKDQVKQLTSRLAKDSHNSHLPPSSDRFARKKKTRSLRKRSGKKPGGQAEHPGETIPWCSHPDEIIRHAVSTCSHCQAELSAVEPQRVEVRQVIELPSKRQVVIEHQAEQKWCPQCGEVSAAAFPEQVRARVQYGSSVAAAASLLVVQHLLPLGRAAEVLWDLLGISIAEATITTQLQRAATVLEPVEQQIKAALIQAEVLHQDESSVRVAGQRWWTHVSATQGLTHYAVHPKRGKAALDAIGILPHFRGRSLHDGFRSYWLYACLHALCNVHHLRELLFVYEEQQQEWAHEMQELLLSMKEACDQARAEGRQALDPVEIADWRAGYETVLQAGYQANPPEPPAPVPKKGRRKQSAARNLLDRLSLHQEAVLAFLQDLRVPFDNSQAERDIRMIKVQQKVSGCFRTPGGAQIFCRLRSYLSSLRKQGLNLFTALQHTFLGHPLLPALQGS
jgi:transposase